MLAFETIAEFESNLGNTNLLEIPNASNRGRVFAKCEWENPTGSIKDRVAYHLVMNELRGRMPGERIKILEYTGGSLGVSLALITRLLGLECRLILSDATSASIINSIRHYGADTVLVDREEGFLGVINKAIAVYEADPTWAFLFQHENSANLECHYQSTGIEILNQAPAGIDAWVASIGTGGSLMGVYQRLREVNPQIALYATNPDELAYGDVCPPNCHKKFSGSGGLGFGNKQRFVRENEHQVKHHFRIRYEDCLQRMWTFYQTEGIKLGSSAAANLIAAEAVAATQNQHQSTYTIFPSLATTEEWNDAEILARSSAKHSLAAAL